jgi:hypothetical protein
VKKIKKRLAVIRFLDHCHHSGSVEEAEPVECEAVGYIARETDSFYVLLAWAGPHDDATSHNNECWVILKSAVTQKKVL